MEVEFCRLTDMSLVDYACEKAILLAEKAEMNAR